MATIDELKKSSFKDWFEVGIDSQPKTCKITAIFLFNDEIESDYGFKK